MNLTGTHINYYRLCKRKLWLFANAIQMEQTSDIVYEGKLIEEESYKQRSSKYEQIDLTVEWGGMALSGKLDFYDTVNGVIHETKKSNKVEDAHIWQVKFYLWLLELQGIKSEYGVLEYPTLRMTESVKLTLEDKAFLEKTIREIKELIEGEYCPPVINSKICKSCSYYDFCYSGEVDDL